MLRGDIEPETLLADRLEGSPWRERPNPAVPTRIVIDPESSQESTILEVVTKDRPGLLFALARALHELDLSIVLAKVSTEGAKAIDVFYVVDENGKKIDSKERLLHIRDTLLSSLEGRSGTG
jgi:[protein-PII] uridylyltransferase